MSEITLTPLALETEEDETALAECWSELMRLRHQIDAEQSEIDRLKAETQAMLTQLKATVGV